MPSEIQREMPFIPEMMPSFESIPQPAFLMQMPTDIPSVEQPQVQEEDDNEVDFSNMMIL